VCATSATADALELIARARELADELLTPLFPSPLAKALDLGSARGFDRAVALLAARLRRAAGSSDAEAVRGALEVLDVDWRATTAAQRRRLINDALVAARRATAVVPTRIETPLGDAAEEVVRATRSHSRRTQRLAIAAEMSALDRRVTDHIVSSQGNFVRDELGRRVDGFGEAARRVVAEAVQQGLGRKDVAERLERAASAALIERSPFYWETVASSFIARGRSFAQMSSYAEARVERYRILAILDESTTVQCRYLHGKVFSVARALEHFERVEALDDPEAIKDTMPWLRLGRDPDSQREVLFVKVRGKRRPLAEVTRSAVGTRDDPGEFRSLATDERLGELGIGFPPYHGLCRTTTLAEI
jgi:SPP1 gp7 family putative phage head morphogenesis protein